MNGAFRGAVSCGLPLPGLAHDATDAGDTAMCLPQIRQGKLARGKLADQIQL